MDIDFPESTREAFSKIILGPRKRGDGRHGLRVLRRFVHLGSLRSAGNGDNRIAGKAIDRLETKLGIQLKISAQGRGPSCQTIPTEAAKFIVAMLDGYPAFLEAIDDPSSKP